MKLNPFRALAYIFFVAAFLLPTVGAFAQVSEFTLSNGLRLVIAESHSVPIVAVDVWVRAGTRREQAGQPGVAHFLEHLLFKGTPTHPTEESIDGSIEDLGGTLDAATSYDWAHFYTEIPSSGCDDAIGLLADIIQHSTISPDSVDQERPVILDEIQRAEDDPGQSLADVARSILYSHGSAYSRPITGTMDEVRGVTHDQIVAFYKQYYVPNNTTIVISGNVSPSDVQHVVEADLDDWKRSDSLVDDGGADASSYAQQVPADEIATKRLIQQGADESYLVMGYPAPSVSVTPDAWDMDVLLTLLGQGGNNRLDTSLRIKQHLVTAIEADYLTQRDPGILTITASMPTANVDDVQADILEEVDRLRTTTVGADELRAAKLALTASYLFDVDTDSGHADSLGFYDSIDSYQYDVNYLSNIDSVTAADVQRIAQTYLNPESCVTVIQVPPTNPTTASNDLYSHASVASYSYGK
jgi:zinc protease